MENAGASVKPTKQGSVAKILGIGCIVLLVGGGFGAFWLVKMFLGLFTPLVETSDRMMTAFAAGKVSDAYGMMSARYRGQNDEAAFADKCKHYGLEKYVSASWSQRHISNGTGRLGGTVTRQNGSISFHVTLVQEGNVWKIDDFHSP